MRRPTVDFHPSASCFLDRAYSYLVQPAARRSPLPGASRLEHSSVDQRRDLDPAVLPRLDDLDRIELVAISGCRVVSDGNPVASLEVRQHFGVLRGINAKPDVLTPDRGRGGILALRDCRYGGHDEKGQQQKPRSESPQLTPCTARRALHTLGDRGFGEDAAIKARQSIQIATVLHTRCKTGNQRRFLFHAEDTGKPTDSQRRPDVATPQSGSWYWPVSHGANRLEREPEDIFAP